MTEPLCTSQGLRDLLRSGRITGMNKNPLLLMCHRVKFLVYSTSSYKQDQSTEQFSQAEPQRDQCASSCVAQKIILDFIPALFGLWGTVYVNLFFFFQKYCRLNFGPNNLDSVPLHFLDEPLSSIMTNYGTWWYVTRTSPPVKGCERNKKPERNISGKKRNFFLFISIRNCRWWNTSINYKVGFPCTMTVFT